MIELDPITKELAAIASEASAMLGDPSKWSVSATADFNRSRGHVVYFIFLTQTATGGRSYVGMGKNPGEAIHQLRGRYLR